MKLDFKHFKLKSTVHLTPDLALSSLYCLATSSNFVPLFIFSMASRIFDCFSQSMCLTFSKKRIQKTVLFRFKFVYILLTFIDVPPFFSFDFSSVAPALAPFLGPIIQTSGQNRNQSFSKMIQFKMFEKEIFLP